MLAVSAVVGLAVVGTGVASPEAAPPAPPLMAATGGSQPAAGQPGLAPSAVSAPSAASGPSAVSAPSAVSGPSAVSALPAAGPDAASPGSASDGSAAAPRGSEQRRSYYVVQPGDTLWGIAKRLDPQADPRALVHLLAEQAGGSGLQVGQRLDLTR